MAHSGIASMNWLLLDFMRQQNLEVLGRGSLLPLWWLGSVGWRTYKGMQGQAHALCDLPSPRFHILQVPSPKGGIIWQTSLRHKGLLVSHTCRSTEEIALLVTMKKSFN